MAHTLNSVSQISPRHQYWFFPRRWCNFHVISLASGFSPYKPGHDPVDLRFLLEGVGFQVAALVVRLTLSNSKNACYSTAGVLETGRRSTVVVNQDLASQWALTSHKLAHCIQALCLFRLFHQAFHLSK